MILTFVLGLVLLIRGFGWEDKFDIVRLRLPTPDRQLTAAAVIFGLIIYLVGGIRGISYAWQFLPNPAPLWWENFSWWLQRSPTIIGHFMLAAIDLLILGTQTYNPHSEETGMISVTDAYLLVRRWNAKECCLVHYGGLTDFQESKNQWFRGPTKAMTSTELQKIGSRLVTISITNAIITSALVLTCVWMILLYSRC